VVAPSAARGPRLADFEQYTSWRWALWHDSCFGDACGYAHFRRALSGFDLLLSARPCLWPRPSLRSEISNV